MKLSYVIISHNRRQRLLETLPRLTRRTPLPADQWETIVVDNASADGTADAVAQQFPQVKLIRNSKNEGMYARNRGIAQSQGQYVITLDDDSYPADGRTIPTCAGVYGRQACGGSGNGKGRIAGWPPGGAGTAGRLHRMRGLFSQVDPGSRGRIPAGVFPPGGGIRSELPHLGRRIARRTSRRHPLQARQNRRRHQPFGGDGPGDGFAEQSDYRAAFSAGRFAKDLLGGLGAALRGTGAAQWSARGGAQGDALGVVVALRDRVLGGRMPLPPAAIDSIFRFREQSAKIGAWARRENVWRVVLAGFSKNMWASFNGCLSSGLQLRCVADENPAFDGLAYRGLPIVPNRRAFEGGGIDGVVVTTVNPAQVEAHAAAVRRTFKGPILKLVEPSKPIRIAATAATKAPARAQAA